MRTEKSMELILQKDAGPSKRRDIKEASSGAKVAKAS